MYIIQELSDGTNNVYSVFDMDNGDDDDTFFNFLSLDEAELFCLNNNLEYKVERWDS